MTDRTMDARDEYRTIAGRTSARLREKASLFLAQAIPVQSREEAEQVLRAIAAEHHDASHHCYAWRLGVDGAEYRAQDAGEPSGSAGKPILAALEHAGLTHVLLVVSRWFGGTKLGVGGLVRAYGDAARSALAAAEVTTVVVEQLVTVDFPHDATSAVMRVLSRFGAAVRETTYDDGVHVVAAVRRSIAPRLCAAVTEETGGKGRGEVRRESINN